MWKESGQPTCKGAGLLGEDACVVHGREDGQAAPQADLITQMKILSLRSEVLMQLSWAHLCRLTITSPVTSRPRNMNVLQCKCTAQREYICMHPFLTW